MRTGTITRTLICTALAATTLATSHVARATKTIDGETGDGKPAAVDRAEETMVARIKNALSDGIGQKLLTDTTTAGGALTGEALGEPVTIAAIKYPELMAITSAVDYNSTPERPVIQLTWGSADRDTTPALIGRWDIKQGSLDVLYRGSIYDPDALFKFRMIHSADSAYVGLFAQSARFFHSPGPDLPTEELDAWAEQSGLIKPSNVALYADFLGGWGAESDHVIGDLIATDAIPVTHFPKTNAELRVVPHPVEEFAAKAGVVLDRDRAIPYRIRAATAHQTEIKQPMVRAMYFTAPLGGLSDDSFEAGQRRNEYRSSAPSQAAFVERASVVGGVRPVLTHVETIHPAGSARLAKIRSLSFTRQGDAHP